MNMKKAVIATAIVGSLVLATTTSANSGAPGSAGDPLVTKSYVDEQISKISGTGGSAQLVVETLHAGQQLIAEAGTEIIVRSGNVVGLMSPAGDGIPNVTAGTDIRGTRIPLNNMLLIPRSDGRGVRVIEGPAYIMVRGAYQIR